MSVVIFIFGDAAHAAVISPATINPVRAMVANDFIFIAFSPIFYLQ
jgi:hypothetical protein